MESDPHSRAKPVHQRPKRSRLSLACERCRLKKRKCTTETPCTHCIKDGLICSRMHRKHVQKSTVPTEESVECYEFQIRRMGAAISELYSRLYSTGTLKTNADGTPFPENPAGVHLIVGLLHLPEDEELPSPVERPFGEDKTLEVDAVQYVNRSSGISSHHVGPSNRTAYSTGSGGCSNESRPTLYSSPSSSPSPAISDISDSSSLFNDEQLLDWYGQPDANVYLDGSMDQLPFSASSHSSSISPLGNEPFLMPSDDWPCGAAANFNAFTVAFYVSLMRPLPVTSARCD